MSLSKTETPPTNGRDTTPTHSWPRHHQNMYQTRPIGPENTSKKWPRHRQSLTETPSKHDRDTIQARPRHHQNITIAKTAPKHDSDVTKTSRWDHPHMTETPEKYDKDTPETCHQNMTETPGHHSPYRYWGTMQIVNWKRWSTQKRFEVETSPPFKDWCNFQTESSAQRCRTLKQEVIRKTSNQKRSVQRRSVHPTRR